MVGSFDIGDSSTTNLYIGNVNPTVNENDLCDIFAAFGPLASVKIMWPRTDEERARNRNSGFVAYMDRTEAEMALKSLNGVNIKGYGIKLDWAKPVAMPPQPIALPDPMKMATAQTLILNMLNSSSNQSNQLSNPSQSSGPTTTSRDSGPSSLSVRIKGCLKLEEREQLEVLLKKLETKRTSIGDAMLFCINHSIAAKEVIDVICQSIIEEDKKQHDHDQQQQEKQKESQSKSDNIRLEKYVQKELAKLYLISDILHNSSAQVTNASYYRSGFKTKLEDIFMHIGCELSKWDLKINEQSTINSASALMTLNHYKGQILAIFKAWKDWTLYEDDFLVRLSGLTLGLHKETASNKDIRCGEGEDMHSVNSKKGENMKDHPRRQASINNQTVNDLDGAPLSEKCLLESLESKGLTLDWYIALGLHEDEKEKIGADTKNCAMVFPGRIEGTPNNASKLGFDEVDHPHPNAIEKNGASNDKIKSSYSLTGGAFKTSKWETVDPSEVAEQVVTLSKWSKSFISIEEPCSNDSLKEDHSKSYSKKEEDNQQKNEPGVLEKRKLCNTSSSTDDNDCPDNPSLDNPSKKRLKVDQ